VDKVEAAIVGEALRSGMGSSRRRHSSSERRVKGQRNLPDKVRSRTGSSRRGYKIRDGELKERL
jgi:hypothetical protein